MRRRPFGRRWRVCRQLEVTTAIAKSLSYGNVHSVKRDVAATMRGFKLPVYDHLSMRLNIKIGALKDIGLELKYEHGIVQNMNTIVAEYREKQEDELHRQKRQELWAAKVAEPKKDEADLMESESAPLRNYLMKNVMPTLTQGPIEVINVRPDDPVDYLAEHLFKNNPIAQ
eukprot:Clim_evm12s171 gene=Clim_evmTU12s171